MIVRMNIEYSDFMKSCDVIVSKVPFASRTVIEKAGAEIMLISKSIVPIDTNTLRETAYYNVESAGSFHEATIGYADAEHDKANPISKRMASTYAVVVHEDLYAHHSHGMAKFLTSAVAYWSSKYPNVVKDVFQQLGLV